MKIQFRCKLLSDVVLNMHTGTTGNQSTLDFIPGNCFLGIVASSFSEFGKKETDILFSGKVRFGDAHLAYFSGQQTQRSLHIPASMMYQKLHKLSEGCYLHHFYERSKDNKGENGRPMQLKQCRNGYYAFSDGKAIEVQTEKSFAIKSAYDREKRRSADEQMYGYESIDKGAVFLFEVEVDQNEYVDVIRKSLLGMKKIGRSRTAQYGLVEISETSFGQTSSRPLGFLIDGENYVTVYADARLIFIDDDGMQTFRPKAQDFGFDGDICWTKSQVRTFQYAPYNYKRQARDAERCGIEKGSVFVIRTKDVAPEQSHYVGCFQNEGFGRVIFNPDFLDTADYALNGECKYSFKEKKVSVALHLSKSSISADEKKSPFIEMLTYRKLQSDADAYIYERVNAFVKQNAGKFSNQSFASQWGNIRSIAMRCQNYDMLVQELFDKKRKVHHTPTSTDPKDEDRYIPSAYLSHGVAYEKWNADHGVRIKLLRDFIKMMNEKQEAFKKDITIEAVINLASEMAKKCSKK